MDAPGHPARLRLLGGACLFARHVRRLDDGLGRPSQAVDDGIARDRIEPGRARAARWVEAAGRPPDGCKRLLRGILGAATVAEAAERQPEHWACEAAVQLLECRAVAGAHEGEQLAVGGRLE